MGPREEELFRAATQVVCDCGCEHPVSEHLLLLLATGAVTFLVFMVIVWKWLLVGESTARHDDMTWLRDQLKEDIDNMRRALWMEMQTLDDRHEAELTRQRAAEQAALLRQLDDWHEAALTRQRAAEQAALLRQGAAIIHAEHVNNP